MARTLDPSVNGAALAESQLEEAATAAGSTAAGTYFEQADAAEGGITSGIFWLPFYATPTA